MAKINAGPQEHSALEILRRLVRFDTTNPPGNERECMAYIAALLEAAGCRPAWLARDENRPNLLARLPGEGSAPPLLLYGHLDVVTTEGQAWPHPPFAGEVADGMVWGRGTLDMKGGIAMMLAACLQAKRQGIRLPGEVRLAMLSDEEADGTYGAKFLVEEQARWFDGIRYAIGEFGGFSLHLAGRRFYPIMVAEKQVCNLRLRMRGVGGHGALPVRQGGALAKLARVLAKLERHRFSVHIDPVVVSFLRRLAAELPLPQRALFHLLLRPAWTDRVLDLLGEKGRLFDPMLHDTVAATVVRGGSKFNVIPTEVEVRLDARLLPGRRPESLLRELATVIGEDAEIEMTRFDPGPTGCDLGLLDTLSGVLRQCDREAIPVPFLLTGTTDARFFHRLGIQTYGFLPMRLPPDFNFAATIHSASERIPVDALEFGTRAISLLLRGFGEAASRAAS